MAIPVNTASSFVSTVAGNSQQTSNNSNLADQLEQSRSSAYFLPPIDVVNTWNTKRLLPPPLLTQYTPFAVLFLIDDMLGSLFSAEDSGIGDSVILGGPQDTTIELSNDYSDQNDYTKKPGSSILTNTKFFTEALNNNVFKAGLVGGIPARLIGYDGGADVNLIPLSIKFDQLTTPDARGVLEMQNISAQFSGQSGLSINGYGEVNLQMTLFDSGQLFSIKSVINKMFQNFNRFLLVFGWQGPDSVDEIDLADGTYPLNFPTPFVTSNGELGWQTTDSGDRYIVNLGDTDGGNRMTLALMNATIPDLRFEHQKISVGIKMTNADTGFHVTNNLGLFNGNASSPMADVRKMMLQKIKDELHPIGFFNVSQIFPSNASYNAEDAQDKAKTLYESILAGDDASNLLLNFGVNQNITFSNTSDLLNQDVPNNTQVDTSAVESDASDAALRLSDSDQEIQNKITLAKNNVQKVSKANTNIDGIVITSNNNLDFVPGVLPQGLADKFQTSLELFLSDLKKDKDPVVRAIGKANDGINFNHSDKGYRTYQQQLNLFKNGSAPAFNPDLHLSMHQLGLAADIQGMSGLSKLKQAGVHKYASNRNLRFPYAGEPWHCEYKITRSTNDDAGETDPSIFTSKVNLPQQAPASPKSSSFIGPTQPQDNTIGGQLKRVKQLPAMYRLGDVITVLSETFDEYFHTTQGTNSNQVNGVIRLLDKLDIEYLKIVRSGETSPSTIPIGDLNESDVFANNSIRDEFKNAIIIEKTPQKDVEQGTLSAKKDLSGGNAFDFGKLTTQSPFNSIAETIGYQIVASDKDDQPQYSRFKDFLQHVKSNIWGRTLLENNPNANTRNIFQLTKISDTVFTWDNNYIDSLQSTPMEAISVADIPVSVHTLSRIMQSMVYTKSIEDLINQILTAVSIDYGFSLHFLHKVKGAFDDDMTRGSIITDYEYAPQQRRKTSHDQVSDTDSRRIHFMIYDKFLTNEFTASKITQELDSIAAALSNQASAPNQIQTTLGLSPTTISAQRAHGQIADQLTIIQNEYSKSKLNSVFLLDFGASNSLQKMMTYGVIDGTNSIVNQIAINSLANRFSTSEQSGRVRHKLPDAQRAVVRNFNSAMGLITKKIVIESGALQGTRSFETRFLNLATEFFQSINPDPNNPNFQQDVDATKFTPEVVELIKEIRNTEKQIINPEDRHQFLSEIFADYLYNRPMGMKYQFYLGKITAELHGITGLGITQGFYARGITSALDGVYEVSKISYNLSNAGFTTLLDGTLVQSDVIASNLKALVNIGFNTTTLINNKDDKTKISNKIADSMQQMRNIADGN